MNKFFLLNLFFLVFILKSNSQSIITLTINDVHNNRIGDIYLSDENSTPTMWGCSDSLIPFKEGGVLCRVTTTDRYNATVVLLETVQQQNNLTLALYNYLKQGYSLKVSFQKIFDFFAAHQESPDWTKELLVQFKK